MICGKKILVELLDEVEGHMGETQSQEGLLWYQAFAINS
jgi:hypothetical protein